VIAIDDEDEVALLDDAGRLLVSAVDAARHPTLATALAGPDATAFRRELMDLFAPQFRARAPRLAVRAIGRLEGPGYNEPILLKDISLTGVRFLVQSDVSLDLTKFASMHLQLRTNSGKVTLPVALVRRCGGDEHYTDLACRFLAPTPDHQEVVTKLRSRIFADEPPKAEGPG